MTEGNGVPQPTPELIVRAARVLAGVCDGAHEKDNVGYNGVDSQFMQSLAGQGTHTDRQLRAMWHTLRKYRKQLASHGVNYDELVAPALPARDGAGRFQSASRRLKLIWVDTKYGRRIALVFGYNVDMVNIARGLEKRWFDGERKAWLIPDEPEAFDNALGAFEAAEPAIEIEVEPELKAHTDRVRESRRQSYQASAAATSDFQVPTKLPLLPFQRAGVEYIDAHGGRALVGDEMGLGKTAQAIGWLSLRREQALPALIVVPAVVRVNWVREFAKFSDLKPLVVVSKSNLKSFEKLGIDVSDKPEPGYDAVIVNYDLFHCPILTKFILRSGEEIEGMAKKNGSTYTVEMRDGAVRRVSKAQITKKKKRLAVELATINGIGINQWVGFKTIVMDEAHAIKESDSQRTAVSLELARRTPHAILLTGTPLLNRPKEVWTLTQACDPTVFPKFFGFAKEFCNAQQGKFGWDFNGASNTDKLARILRERLMVRREKMEVLKELPERTRTTIPIALNGALKAYTKEAAPSLEALVALKRQRDELKARLAGMDDEARRLNLAKHAEEKAKLAGIHGHIISEITKLRKVAGLAKIEPATDFILDTVEQTAKVIVFAWHHDVIDSYVGKLVAAGIKVEKIDGREDAVSRQKAIDSFQDGDAQVIVMSIGAGGVGINLQAASNVIFVELPWRPGDVDQAEARAWRMGQKNAVTTWFLMGLGTIEEAIAKTIDAKREIVNAVVGETDRTIDEVGILDAILDDVLAGAGVDE